MNSAIKPERKPGRLSDPEPTSIPGARNSRSVFSRIIRRAPKTILWTLGFLILAGCYSNPPHRGDSYLNTEHWHRYQRFLPESMRFTAENLPREEYWQWNGHKVHLDRYGEDSSACKVILLHGGGGNGRILGPVAVLVYELGCTVVAPDMPGYGLTVPNPETELNYGLWVELTSHLMDKERRPGQRLYVFGLSIGGMLAYQAVAMNGQADGLIATTFADVRRTDVRDAVSANLFLSRVGVPLGSLFRWFTDGVYLPIASLSKMELITNDPAFSEVFATDPHAGGGWVSLLFLRTFMNYAPALEPEEFRVCPVLMIHPGLDPWTPLEMSKEFYDRIPEKKRLVVLQGAGHLPYEEPGRTQMVRALKEFLGN
ncbi:MAG: alpha/beta hydrolase [Spirochaetaceae bacterium]|nr:alpha/beta hydrolase [Spirochaetaceae bacterium]